MRSGGHYHPTHPTPQFPDGGNQGSESWGNSELVSEEPEAEPGSQAGGRGARSGLPTGLGRLHTLSVPHTLPLVSYPTPLVLRACVRGQVAAGWTRRGRWGTRDDTDATLETWCFGRDWETCCVLTPGRPCAARNPPHVRQVVLSSFPFNCS